MPLMVFQMPTSHWPKYCLGRRVSGRSSRLLVWSFQISHSLAWMVLAAVISSELLMPSVLQLLVLIPLVLLLLEMLMSPVPLVVCAAVVWRPDSGLWSPKYLPRHHNALNQSTASSELLAWLQESFWHKTIAFLCLSKWKLAYYILPKKHIHCLLVM